MADLLSREIRHQVRLQGVKKEIVSELLTELNKDWLDVARTIRNSDYSKKVKLSQLLTELRSINNLAFDKLGKELLAILESFVEVELNVQKSIITNSYPNEEYQEPDKSAALILALVLSTPVLGYIPKESTILNRNQSFARIKGSVTQSRADGLSEFVAAQNVYGTPSQQFRNGVLNPKRNQVSSFISSVLQSASTVVAEETYKAQPFIDKVIWISVLDSKTTPICQSLSKKIFPIGEGIRPPAHHNCRSRTVPYNPRFNYGLSYQEWLLQQPKSEVVDILGPTRAKLFLNGDLELGKNYVDRLGQKITLDQYKDLLT